MDLVVFVIKVSPVELFQHTGEIELQKEVAHPIKLLEDLLIDEPD